MNTTENFASLESSAPMGLDELNYDSIWNDSEAATEETEQEELTEEEEEVAE